MASSSLIGDDDGAPIFDSLAKFYTSVAIVWTVVILSGAGLLIANRREQCIRIRNLSLVLSAVGCLHVYWILCLVAYSMNGRYPCVAEYWIMSIYLPLGIALFQANSMQLLSIFGIQEKLLLAAHRPYVPHLTGRTYSSGRYLDKWRQLNLVQRTEFGIGLGMVIQIILSLCIFLTSRKFQSFGTWDVRVSPSECRRGPEWVPSILWQLTWSWLFAPYVLWKIRNIHDVHHWRLQITICLIANLPGSPMWFAALYSSTATWEAINKYWVPALWFTPGIVTMEAVTIFFPLYEVLISRRRKAHMLEQIQVWNDKRASKIDEPDSRISTSQSEISGHHVPEIYSRDAMEQCLLEDPGTLLRFAAAKEFSGENIIFLNYVRDWKAWWAKIGESQLEYDWAQDPENHRQHMFKIAVEIHASCVNLETAQFPINIESQIYSNLMDLFGEASLMLVREAQGGNSRYYSNIPDGYPMPTHRKKFSTVITVEEDKHALCYDAFPFESHSIMHVESRLPDSVVVPGRFSSRVFDQAEKSVKNLVFTNTWPKFVESSSRTSSIHSK
ncbi:hypothetical protein N7456_010881 [Penicillium angulare]|uniref:Uncharacterized protein n=1 Tax=Penicillium angulare TaxID=116970 RepID=A0A9W9EST9_9EURO|nr:hypothetical protein N7456_010881 [Penicillium angulare]